MAPRVLMIERDIGSGRQVERDLRSQGFEVLRVQGPDAVETLASHTVDLVLIEFKEATMGNIELCRTIKGAAEVSGDSTLEPAATTPDAPNPDRGGLRLIGFVPVLLLTGEDPASVVRGFEAGADDCIHWPYDLGEMLARVRSMLRIKTLHDELRRTTHELVELSTLDGLTALYNRRYLFEQLAAEVERAVRYQQPLSLLMLDTWSATSFSARRRRPSAPFPGAWTSSPVTGGTKSPCFSPPAAWTPPSASPTVSAIPWPKGSSPWGITAFP
jgi:PleD family two-component response regulator